MPVAATISLSPAAPVRTIDPAPVAKPTDRGSPDPASDRASTKTRGEVAGLLGVSERHVRRWVTEYGEFFADGLDLSGPEIEKLRIIQRMAGQDGDVVRGMLGNFVEPVV